MHRTQVVADAILSIPGCRLVHPASPEWWHWKAEWASEGRSIVVSQMSDCEVDLPEIDRAFGGASLAGHATMPDILRFWGALCEKLDGIWFHDPDCRLWSPESFEREWGREDCDDVPEIEMDWLSDNVVALARTIRSEFAFDRLPILADALEEAGCTDETVLEHCRNEGNHGRGCWVTDQIFCLTTDDDDE
jgi:hypothetical protein